MKELYFSSWGQEKTYVPNRWNKLNLISEDINYYLTALLENDKYLNNTLNEDSIYIPYITDLSASANDDFSIDTSTLKYIDIEKAYDLETKNDILYVNNEPFGQKFSSYSHVCYNSSTNCYNDNEYISAVNCIYDPHTYNKISIYSRNAWYSRTLSLTGNNKEALLFSPTTVITRMNGVNRQDGCVNTSLARPQYPNEYNGAGTPEGRFFFDYWVNRGIKGCCDRLSASYCQEFEDVVNEIPMVDGTAHVSIEVIPEDCTFHYYGDVFLYNSDRENRTVSALDANRNIRNDVFVETTMNQTIPLYFDLCLKMDMGKYSYTKEGQSHIPMSAIEEIPIVVQSGITITQSEYSLPSLHIDFALENKPITFSAYSSWTDNDGSHKELHTWTAKPCNIGFVYLLKLTGCYISAKGENDETIWNYVTATNDLPFIDMANTGKNIQIASAYSHNNPTYIVENIECDIYFKPDNNVLTYYTGEQ